MTKKSINKTYIYKGIRLRGDKLTGEIDATSLQMARLKLHKQNITPTSIRQKHRSLTWSRPIKSIDIVLFFRQLSTMLNSGIALTKALDTIQQNSQNPSLKTIIHTIKTDIETGGTTFAHALKKHTLFSRFAVALVDAGERSGSLDVMLTRIAHHQERLETLKNKLKKAMYYPLAVMAVALIVTIVLLIKVVPIFAKMFGNLGQELPLPTRIIMAMSDVLVTYFWSMLAVVFLAALGLTWLHQKTDKTARLIDSLSLKLPLIKTLTKKTALARFTRTLATTFEAGVPLLTALELSAQATNHRTFIKELQKAADKVRGGQKLGHSLAQSTLFLPMTVQMIDVGEESGRLTQMLDKVADYYDDEINEQIDGLTSLIEPIIMLVLGLVVGTVVLAMYLPIFNMGANLP